MPATQRAWPNGGVTCEDPPGWRKGPGGKLYLFAAPPCGLSQRLICYIFKSFQRSNHERWKLFSFKTPSLRKTPARSSASATLFDEAYYQRFYFDKKTSVVDPEHMERLGMFVCSHLKYLRVPVRRVLDVGCGIGLWKGIVERHFPGASYQGVEFSPYLCERFGWQQGSVVDYAASEPFDWVICQGVLPYLNPADVKAALHNLGRLSKGALYVEAVSREDYEQDIIDEVFDGQPRLPPPCRAVPARPARRLCGAGRRRVAEPPGRGAHVRAGACGWLKTQPRPGTPGPPTPWPACAPRGWPAVPSPSWPVAARAASVAPAAAWCPATACAACTPWCPPARACAC